MIVVYAVLAVFAMILTIIVCDIRDIKTAVERIKHEFTKIYDDDTWA